MGKNKKNEGKGIDCNELFPAPPGWPKLLIKVGAYGLLTWLVHRWLYDYATEWDCYATEKVNPNPVSGRNMTAAFTRALYVEYILCWVALCTQIFHMASKCIKLDSFKIVVGWIEMAFYLCAFAWLIWASIIRFRVEG